jgi:hypothetical protein
MIAANTVTSAIKFLHAASFADLHGWTEADIYSYLNRSLVEAGSATALVGRFDALVIAAGAAEVVLPANTTTVIQAAWGYKTLKIQTVAEMDALEGNWPNSPGQEPESLIVDQQGLQTVRLWPTPDSNGLLRMFTRQKPATQSAVSQLAIPEAVHAAIELEIIAEARRKAGQHAMPEAAAAAQQIADMLKVATQAYYGGNV